MLLISVELVLMLFILLFIPRDYSGPCFIGFAIGESLGAAVLRVAGGIFTKIADIGADLMKIVFKIKEDDARNPGVIADCTGDNAGDSVGPSADGFETYGVTGVALISFIVLAVSSSLVQSQLLVWIFAMRVMMVISSGLSYLINAAVAKSRYGNAVKMNFEAPLTSLVWLTSLVSIAATYIVSYAMIPDLGGDPTSLVEAFVRDHLRHSGWRCHSRTGQSLHVDGFDSRARDCGFFSRRGSLAEHSFRVRRGQHERLLARTGDSYSDEHCLRRKHARARQRDDARPQCLLSAWWRLASSGWDRLPSQWIPMAR